MRPIFLAAHLDNVQVVLTEQTDFSQYLATMPACRLGRDQPNAQTEDALFYNLDNTRVDIPWDSTTVIPQKVRQSMI